MKRVFFTIVASVLFSSSAFAGEPFSSESDSWQDYYSKGRNAVDARDYSNADKYLEKAKAITKNFKPGDSRAAATISELLTLDEKINSHAKSVAHLIEERDTYIKAFGANYCQVGLADENIASHYLALGKPAEAEELYRTAIGIIEQSFGSSSLKLAELYHDCAVAQWQMGKPVEALQTIRKEETILETCKTNCDGKRAGNLMMQADIFESLNKPKEAQSAWSKYYDLTSSVD